MPQPRPTFTTFRARGGGAASTGVAGLQRRLRTAGLVLLAFLALGLTLLIVVPLTLLLMVVGAVWIIYKKLSRAFSSLFGGRGRGGRRNVRVIER